MTSEDSHKPAYLHKSDQNLHWVHEESLDHMLSTAWKNRSLGIRTVCSVLTDHKETTGPMLVHLNNGSSHMSKGPFSCTMAHIKWVLILKSYSVQQYYNMGHAVTKGTFHQEQSDKMQISLRICSLTSLSYPDSKGPLDAGWSKSSLAARPKVSF